MYYVADTNRLLAEGVLTPPQVETLRLQARETMMQLGINALLAGGILAATFGLIFWLASPISVAAVGFVMLASGAFALTMGQETLRFFGNAAALIGAGMLLGGAGFELANSYEAIAGPAMMLLGATVAAAFAAIRHYFRDIAPFTLGAVFLMGGALHLAGLGFWAEQLALIGWPAVLAFLYATAVIIASGILVNVRFVTALAILPFAQALSTGTAYWHAVYAFYSPESTLSILQMSALVAVGLWAASRLPDRIGRHGGILATMGLIVANLCALVGSLWGDWVGETIWGPQNRSIPFETWEARRDAVDAFRETAIHIPDTAYSILWAVALVAVIIWAANGVRRGVFNTACTFACIHAYTQAFETFGDEPLAYVIGGLTAIPLAWGLWQWNRRMLTP
ncbi:hypothetical protein V8J82_18035 [Gymnodinialimonas sp. 2305UL16-5]|uniref:hypothetical protein n=1 Tax=Gymnodinialimonas mytili TaxID=3126503 RepID=UPI0030A845DC